MWAFIYTSSALYFRAYWRYSVAISSRSGSWFENRAGFSRMPSEDITPSTPVCFRHLSISEKYWIPPLATTGIWMVYLIFLIVSQSASVILNLICSFVLPWTVNSEHPSSSMTWTSCLVCSQVGRIRILQNRGISSPRDKVPTIYLTSSISSNKNAP